VAVNGSSSGNGSINNPWDLQTALNQPSSVQPGATIYLRGGIYRGKFVSQLSGSQSAPIVVRSYPGEWAVLDGYKTVTITNALSSPSVTQATFNSNDGIRVGTTLMVLEPSEPDPYELEGFTVTGFVSGTTWNLHRGDPHPHAAGATAVFMGHNLQVQGSDTRFISLEVRNSDPVRIAPTPNSQVCPHQRGSLDVRGERIKIINCVIHDMELGVSAFSSSYELEVYGSIIYNNGCVAGGVFNGHGLYAVNDVLSRPKLITNSIVFNNFADGIKAISQNGDSFAIHVTGTAAFNSGSPAGTTVRRGSLLMSANNGSANDLRVDNSHIFDPLEAWGGGGGIAFTDDSGTGSFTNSVVATARDGLSFARGNMTVTGNKVVVTSPTNGPWLNHIQHVAGTYTINNNTYYNASGISPLFIKNGAARTFANWQANLGYDLNSTYSTSLPTGKWIYVRPNFYEPGRAHIIIYNWDLSPTVNVNVAGVLSNGDQYAVYAAENVLGSAVLTGTYNGGSIAIPMTGTQVAPPAGADGVVIHTPTTIRPRFGVFILKKL
jgi:hypothetical protein